MKGNVFDYAIVGLSHLGLVTSIGFTALGQKIVGLDSNPAIIDSLTKGIIPFYEPGLDELLLKNSSKIFFQLDFSVLKNIDCVFFSQDTSTDGNGSVEKLNNLIDKAIPHFKDKVTIVCMSQVPIGYYRSLQQKIKLIRPGLTFKLYHLVDTIIMTNAIDRFIHPERIIIGSSNPKEAFSAQLREALLLFPCPVFHMSYEAAELTKAAINLYLASSITYANTLADFCELAGANINEIIPALRTDKRIGFDAYIRPSLRISGGHLERDLFMLKKLALSKQKKSGIVDFILKQNSKRYHWLTNKINTLLPVGEKRLKVCIWGLSYKSNSTSTEDAVSLKIINALNKNFDLTLYDPIAILPKKYHKYPRLKDKYVAAKNADCLLVLTEWPEFKSIDLEKLKGLLTGDLILDGVSILDNKKVNLLFNYHSPGKGKLSA